MSLNSLSNPNDERGQGADDSLGGASGTGECSEDGSSDSSGVEKCGHNATSL
ncbi:hypothetical protein [Rossellomorea sp. SC111]|uniref:hypothetical protein n=1 Tax=Rossellomorea sp. SC111 TaxID=2968985 RepID=UPI00215A7CEC|nr:hypothetical protein [Rossellomorea sp. SC111]